MVSPKGFWEANSPASNPATDDATIEQHNMNRTLTQKGDTAHLIAVLTKEGVTGYQEALGIFRRANASGALEDMPTIRLGVDADKPTEDAANNGSWYFTTDTKVLSVIHNATRVNVNIVGLPSVASPDNNNLLQVVSGMWAKVTGISAAFITSGVLAAIRRRDSVSIGSVDKTLTIADEGKLIVVNTSSADRAIMLPNITSGDVGVMFSLFKTGATNLLYIRTNGSDTINSMAEFAMVSDDESVVVKAQSTTEWAIVAHASPNHRRIVTTTGNTRPAGLHSGDIWAKRES